MRWTLFIVAAACLAPFVAADAQLAGGYMSGQDVPDSPQLFCEVVQTEAHTASSPYRCDITGYAAGVTVIRARVVGIGHAYAWADYGSGQQTSFLSCSATTEGPSFPSVLAGHPDHTPYYKMCSGLVAAGLALSTTFALHARVDGAGGATYSVWLEHAYGPVPLP
jgi:hypothetical protein